MVRVETSTDCSDLLFSCYTGKQGKTAVLLNRSTKPLQVEVNDFGFTPVWMERTSYFLENEVYEWSKNNFLIIEPGEVITLSNVSLNN